MEEQTMSQVLQRARALVAAGSCQGPYYKEIDGQQCYCAVGAVYTALGVDYEVDDMQQAEAAEDVLNAAAVALSGHSSCSAVGWNEAPEHTQADVLALFDRALAEVTK